MKNINGEPEMAQAEQNINVQFTEEEYNMILEYQKVSEAVTVQAAILNAISLALDYLI